MPPTPEEIAAAEKAAKEKEAAEKAAREAEDKKPQNLDDALAELERMREALKAANSEAAERRKKLKSFEDAETKRQEEEKKRRDADLTEVERLKKQNEEAQAKLEAHETHLKTERARNAFERAVRKAGLVFANDHAEEDAFEAFGAALAFDDDGKPKTPEKVLEAITKERPYLLTAGKTIKSPNLNARDGGGGPTPENEKEREAEIRRRFRLS